LEQARYDCIESKVSQILQELFTEKIFKAREGQNNGSGDLEFRLSEQKILSVTERIE
jgi:hypothetical protein